MVKLTFCLRKLPDWSREDFQQYWREVHGALVARHAPVLGIRRYVQVHTKETRMNIALRESRSAMEPFDGVAEVWYDSVGALAASVSTPEGSAASEELLDDERRFIDLTRSCLWMSEEFELLP